MIKRIIPYAHELLESYVTKGDYVIDGTLGNGHDTLFLTGISKHVYSFDVQEEAISSSSKLLIENNVSNYTLIHDSHENINEYINNKISAAIFNLGYLPGGTNQDIITRFESTSSSIKSIFNIMDKGIIIVVCYIGHDGGKLEAELLESEFSTISSKNYNVLKYQFLNKLNSPYILAIEKTN